jgi:hypothetical protein
MRRVAVRLLVVAMISAGVAPAPEAIAEVPRAQRIFMVSDSVGIGAESALRAALPGTQFTLVGKPGQFVETLAASYVAPQPASLFGDIAIVAGGYNFPYWDPPRFDRSVDLMVSTLLAKGVRHVLWVTLRELKPQYMSGAAWRQAQSYAFYLPTVNEHLRRALARHPQLSLVDWAAIADRPGLTYDAIHLNTAGAGEYARIVKDGLDTVMTRIPGGTTRVIAVAGRGGVPADAAGVALTLTAVDARTPAFVTIWPCDSRRPLVSNLNVGAAEIASSSVILPLGADGTLCTYANGDTHLVVDITGVFTRNSGFLPVVPRRAVDTRETGLAPPGIPLVVGTASTPGLPPDAAAIAVNVTTIGGPTAADIRVYPCNAPPAAPVRSTTPGAIQNLMLVTRTSTAGTVCVTASEATEVIVDVFGGFAAGSKITPLAPIRLLDTRGGAPVYRDTSRAIDLVGAAGLATAPTGAALTVSAVGPTDPGFVTAWPCDAARTATSFINTLPARDRTGSTFVAVGRSGSACLYSSSTTHLVATLTGWSGAGFAAITPFRALDSRIP